jgi:hypothetical protein
MFRKRNIPIPLCKLKKRKGTITHFKQIKFYKMKKIIGILGITLIMAVSFFNMSSITDVKQNVDLASLLQNASADPESSLGYKDKYETNYMVHIPYNHWVNGRFVYSCVTIAENNVVDCYGYGIIDCTPSDTYDIISSDCPAGSPGIPN